MNVLHRLDTWWLNTGRHRANRWIDAVFTALFTKRGDR